MKNQNQELNPLEIRRFVSFTRLKVKNFIWFLLVLTPAVMSFHSHISLTEDLWQSKEIRFKKSEISQLFTLKSSEKATLNLSTDAIQSTSVEIMVKNHVNKGAKTGALACQIKLGSQDGRFLLNRKDRGGKLVYWMAILPSKGNDGFKLKEETAVDYILEKVTKDQIVTE
jgi:hypothetical protein